MNSGSSSAAHRRTSLSESKRYEQQSWQQVGPRVPNLACLATDGPA
jgi:hypothetical protein